MQVAICSFVHSYEALTLSRRFLELSMTLSLDMRGFLESDNAISYK